MVSSLRATRYQYLSPRQEKLSADRERDLLMTENISALVGGSLIGLASLLMLLFNGKILGVSGIAGGLFQKHSKETLWRSFFLIGLLAGGGVLTLILPSAFSFSLDRSVGALVLAGLLVGYGTRLGNGCTSGHGICGVSRLSPRSLMATLTFMALGAIVVFFINHVLGGRI